MRGLTLVVAVAFAGCSAVPSPTASSSPVATASPSALVTIDLGPELLGPWQPTPLHLDPAAVSEMDAQCLAFDLFAPSVSSVVVDARGEGRVILHYAGEDGHEGTCDTQELDGSFIIGPRSHTEPSQNIEVVPVGDHELRVLGGFGSPGSAAPADQWQGHVGQAGAGIDQVIAEVSGHASPVVASMGDGWFALWFPIADQWEWRLVGLNAAGEEVATLSQP